MRAQETGKHPITGEDLSVDDLIQLKSNKASSVFMLGHCPFAAVWSELRIRLWPAYVAAVYIDASMRLVTEGRG